MLSGAKHDHPWVAFVATADENAYALPDIESVALAQRGRQVGSRIPFAETWFR